MQKHQNGNKKIPLTIITNFERWKKSYARTISKWNKVKRYVFELKNRRWRFFNPLLISPLCFILKWSSRKICFLSSTLAVLFMAKSVTLYWWFLHAWKSLFHRTVSKTTGIWTNFFPQLKSVQRGCPANSTRCFAKFFLVTRLSGWTGLNCSQSNANWIL